MLNEVLDDLVAYLTYLKEEGQEKVAVRPETLQALTAPVSIGPAPVAVRSGPLQPAVPPAAPLSREQRQAGLAAIATRVAQCRNCPLHASRSKTVPGQGCLDPEVMFIGEGPGRDEDLQGLAFVDRAGQLLTRLIQRMGYIREQVFIANIVKCRASVDYAMLHDRAPFPGEMSACLPYLDEQIALIRPKLIVCLGGVALQGLFNQSGITRLRGKWLEYKGIPAMPTYHPSYLLCGEEQETKQRFWDVWSDMLQVLQRIGREPVPKT